MKIYNSLGREKQEFTPLKEGEVSMYTCGPTVYGLPHIGNYRSFFMSDLIRRYLEYRGFKVKHVMNITDIDDKTIRDSKSAGQTLKEFTMKYEAIFLKGLDALNIKRAHVYPRATEHITEMVEIIEKLEANGLAYKKEDGIYYAINKFADYGKLSQVDLANTKAGARVAVDEYDKDNPQDFVLWKKASAEEVERSIFYKTKWFDGRPGWHIECSAMSTKHLGDSFDIHTGAVDLLFPHHENELAQTEGATGKQFVKYWMHGEHLIVNNEKMAKSKGNYFTLDDLLKNYDYNSIRYLFLETHYRDKLNYTEETMLTAVKNIEKLGIALQAMDFFLQHSDDGDDAVHDYKAEFVEAMDDDFNSVKALQIIHKLIKDFYKYVEKGRSKKTIAEYKSVLLELLGVFGLFEKDWKAVELDAETKKMIADRNSARAGKDFDTADKLRDTLKEKGIQLDDYPEGTLWRKV